MTTVPQSDGARKSKRKRTVNTTKEQYEEYLRIMESEYIMRSGTVNPTLGENYVEKKWEYLSETLNSMGSGPQLPAEIWKKRFTDWKNSTRAKARKIQVERLKTGGGEESKLKLSDLEERGLAVWGKVAITGSPFVPVTGGLSIQDDLPIDSPITIDLEVKDNCDLIYNESSIVTDITDNVSHASYNVANSRQTATNSETPNCSTPKQKHKLVGKNLKDTTKNSLQDITNNLLKTYEKNVNLTSTLVEEIKSYKTGNLLLEEKKLELENKKFLFEVAKYKYENQGFIFDV